MTREQQIWEQIAEEQARQLEETLERFEEMVEAYNQTMQRVCMPLHGLTASSHAELPE